MKKQLGTGIIGCGGFVRGVHIPNILKNPKYRIIATADINEAAAKSTSEATGSDYYTSDIRKILDDKDIEVVFITTRHDSHADLTVKAALAGKHVLCEKPMGLDLGECRRVAETLRKTGVKYTIGYNRGIAPMAVKARELLAETGEKIMAYYRMQNGLPSGHWLLDRAIGGGRITGEGCHIFDMLCEVIQKPPVRVYASGGSFLSGSPDPCDSAQILITFADGSAATALLMSAGCGFFSKEAVEIYAGGKSVFIDNFREMQYCGFAGKKSVKISFDPQDKGHADEIDLLADAILHDKPAPNGCDNALRAAVIGFKAVESINSGKPVDVSEADYKPA